MFLVDVFLYDNSDAGDSKKEYKALGKAGITVIDSPGGSQQIDVSASSSIISMRKMVVLYRSKKETLMTCPIQDEKFIFDIQNETYGCLYSFGRNKQTVFDNCVNVYKTSITIN